MRQTFGEWYPNVDFAFVTDAGHYPMQEAPIYLAALIERFLNAHRGGRHQRASTTSGCRLLMAERLS